MSEHAGHPEIAVHPDRPTGVTGAPLQQLSPAWPKAERLSWFVFDAVILIPTIVGLLVAAGRDFDLWPHGTLLLLWCLAAVILLWATLAYPQAAYRHAVIGVGPFGVEFHRGIWWRKITIVPRSRVQHTDVSQGPIMRRLRIGKLVIHTAGTRNALVEIPGLPYDQALRIRDQLLESVLTTDNPTHKATEAKPDEPAPDLAADSAGLDAHAPPAHSAATPTPTPIPTPPNTPTTTTPPDTQTPEPPGG